LNFGTDPNHILDILDMVILTPLRLLGFAWNETTVHVSGCTGTTVITKLTYFTYTHSPAACR